MLNFLSSTSRTVLLVHYLKTAKTTYTKGASCNCQKNLRRPVSAPSLPPWQGATAPTFFTAPWAPELPHGPRGPCRRCRAATAPLPRRRDALLSILVDVKGQNRAPQNRAPAHTSAPRGEATARRANDAWAVQGGGTGAWGGRGVAEGLAGGGRALEQRTWRRSRPPCLASKNERKKVTSALQVPGPSKSWDPAPAALSLRCSQCPCTGCSCYSRSSGSNCSRESASMNRIADLAVYLSAEDRRAEPRFWRATAPASAPSAPTFVVAIWWHPGWLLRLALAAPLAPN